MLSYCRALIITLAASLTLCALPASAAAVSLASTTPTAFPSTSIGTTSAAQIVQVTLTTPLILNSITVPASINAAQEFVIGAITGCKADGLTLNPAGSTCSISITFKPAYPGARHQPLTLTDITGQTYAFALTGTATGSLSIRYPGIGSTIGGGATAGYSGDGGPATSANIYSPYGLTEDNSGNAYFADFKTGNLRVIYQGNGSDHLACLIEVAEPTLFFSATTLALTPNPTTCAGATSKPVAGDIYTLAGDKTVFTNTVTTHATGASGDGGVISAAKIAEPSSIAVDASGNIFFGDYINYTIRVIYSGGPQVACLIQVENPASFGLPAGTTSCAAATSQPAFGTVWTLVGLSGTPTVGPSGDNGLATSARIVYPYAIALSPAGDIFFTDDSTNVARNSRIRVLYAGGANASSLITLENPAVPTPTYGFLYRLAGNTTLATDSGDGTTLASSAGLLYARGIALDPNGNLFFTEYDTYATASSNPAHKLRAIFLQGTAVAGLLSLENNGATPQPGYIYDVAGINGTTSKGFSGDGGLAGAAQLNFPYGVALDPAGNLYIGDGNNYRIRKVNLTDGIITTAFGTGVQGVASNQAWSPYDIVVNSDGTIAFADFNAYRIRQLSVAANTLTFAAAAYPQQVGTSNLTATSTAFALASNVATITASNNLPVGASVSLAGFTTATYFNGNTYTVTSSSATQFTFAYTYTGPTIPSTPDTGTATYASPVPVQSIVEASIGNTSLNLLGTSAPLNFGLDVPSITGVRACNNTSDTLAAGAQCAVAVHFSPLIAGSPVTGNLNISDTALNTTSTPHSVALVGYSFGTASTILQLTASSFTATPTQTITLTATITGAAGTPTNTVTFTDTTLNTTLCTATLVASTTVPFTASASCPPSTFALGTHKVQATYNGDPNFASTTSNVITLTIALLTPTIKLGSSALSPNFGTAETFTATLSGTLTPPAGNVTFTYGTPSQQIGTVQALPATTPDTAAITTSTLPSGQDCITASYAGDTNYAPVSTSVCVTVIAPAYTLASTVTGVVVPRGSSTIIPLTVTTVGGYAGTLTGSCGNLPAGVTCTFTPSTLAGTGTNGTLSWSVTVSAAASMSSLDRPGSGIVYALLFPFSILGLLTLRRKVLAGRHTLALLLVLLAGASLSGCSGTAGAPKETVNINISSTDTSNSVTATQSIPLTITITGAASH